MGAVGVAGSAFVVTVGVFEDEAVATLQPIRTFLHTAGPVFHVNTLHTLICTLKRRERGGGGVESERGRQKETVRGIEIEKKEDQQRDSERERQTDT